MPHVLSLLRACRVNLLAGDSGFGRDEERTVAIALRAVVCTLGRSTSLHTLFCACVLDGRVCVCGRVCEVRPVRSL